MTRFTCPWCGQESHYEMKTEYNGWRRTLAESSPIQEMDYEKIRCICSSCKGTFDAKPELERYSVSVLEPYVWKNSNGEECTDYDMTSYDLEDLREKYLVQEGYVKPKRFSLEGNGFALPSSTDRFALPPASSKFSLSNLRRRRR